MIQMVAEDADGAESRIKIEYIKLRVSQLKGGVRGSLRSWYRGTSRAERVVCCLISLLLLPAFGLGLIPLVTLTWLAAGEQDELASRAKQDSTSRKSA